VLYETAVHLDFYEIILMSVIDYCLFQFNLPSVVIERQLEKLEALCCDTVH